MTSIVHAKSTFTKVSVPAESSKRLINQVEKSKRRREQSKGRWSTGDPAFSV